MLKVKRSELTEAEKWYGVIPVPNFTPDASLGCTKCFIDKLDGWGSRLCEECLRRNGFGGYYVKSEV